MKKLKDVATNLISSKSMTHTHSNVFIAFPAKGIQTALTS